MDVHTEKEQIAAQVEQRVERRFREAVRTFSLISPGDHILVAVSGGKDSLALLELLAALRQRRNDSFRLTAIHVRMENVDYLSDWAELKCLAEKWGVDLRVVSGSFEPDRNGRRSPCFLCAWHRRKLLFGAAQDWGCNKIALGHHQDDLLRTAMLNLAFSGTFSTMPARLRMKKFPVTLIRPLCLETETDLVAWAAGRAYPQMKKVCPFDKATNRTAVGEVLAAMERLNPDYRYHLWHALVKDHKLVEGEAEIVGDDSSMSRCSVSGQRSPA